MREITSHKTNAVNDAITITVLDEPGPGGASHDYDVSVEAVGTVLLHFQKGPIAEAGVNGITQEALLAIVIDRLECFQNGPFPAPENQCALDHAREALEWLHTRTRNRVERGVEGKSAP